MSTSSKPVKESIYQYVFSRINNLIVDENDWITILATVSCELHQNFNYFHWTGFYRVTEPKMLKVGPYQGNHGCLSIPFHKGVCGYVARHERMVCLNNVREFKDHIACSSTTVSEIVFPIFNSSKELVAVLDIDSDYEKAFCEVDQKNLLEVCNMLTKYAPKITKETSKKRNNEGSNFYSLL